MAPTQVSMGSVPSLSRGIYRLPLAHAARAPMLALRARPVPVSRRAQTCVLGAKTRERSNIAAAADAVAKVGRCPPPRSLNFSTAQTFIGTIFLQLFGSEQAGRMTMTRTRVGFGCAVALVLGISSSSAQGTVKIGLINVLSGQFADAGIQLDNGVKTYMKQHGDTVAGKKIEIIRRDVGGPAPDV